MAKITKKPTNKKAVVKKDHKVVKKTEKVVKEEVKKIVPTKAELFMQQVDKAIENKFRTIEKKDLSKTEIQQIVNSILK